MLDNLQKQFHERLNNAELHPPAGAWERIEEQLPRRNKRGPLFVRASALLLFLFSASTAAFLVYDHFSGPGSGKQEAQVQKLPNRVTPGSNSRVSSSAQHTSPLYASANHKADLLTSPVSGKGQSGFTGKKRSAAAVSAHVNTQQTKQAGWVQTVHSMQTFQVMNGTLASVPLPNNGKGDPVTEGMHAVQAKEIFDPSVLLVSAGPHLLTDDDFNKPVHAGLSPGKPMPPSAFIPKRMQDDPEKIANREKRLSQFKKFDVHRGFHLGGFIGMNMTWMSRKYDLIEHEGNIIDPQTHIGLVYGIIAGYDFNEKWGIQFEPALRNSKGQRFEETCIQTGVTVEKELTLRYFRFPLLLKYNIDLISGSGRRPMVLSVLAGPMFNVLSHRIMLVSEEPVYISPKFVNQAEFGAMSGIDLDFYINKNLYITAGSRLSVASPFERKKPVSIQLGFHTQFNFRMPPKEKIRH